MMLRRGDVVLVHFPFSSGSGAKLRPALVVQCDVNNRRLTNTIIAMITTAVRAGPEPTQFPIAVATPIGRHSGLLHDSAVKCENLFTIEQQLVLRTIGALPGDALAEVDKCLSASLGLG